MQQEETDRQAAPPPRCHRRRRPPCRRQQTTMRRQAVLPLLFVLGACALLSSASVSALEYLSDDTLWMKERWGEWKLTFPWGALKERDAESTRQLQGPLANFPVNSMNGPLLDGSQMARRAEEEARRWAGQRWAAGEGWGQAWAAVCRCRAAAGGVLLPPAALPQPAALLLCDSHTLLLVSLLQGPGRAAQSGHNAAG